MGAISIVYAVLLVGTVCSIEAAVANICNNLPFREQCELLLGENPPATPSSSLPALLQIAQSQALQGLSYIQSLGSRTSDARERQALNDCVELNQQTVNLMNKINTASSSDAFLQQTWLSASLTNLDTCKFGFQDLGVTNNIFGLIPNNATSMISNCLAAVKAPPTPAKTVDGFPKWVKAGDRKLLQSPSVTPNVVVAKDGSGNYKTVSEAVAAAPGSSRFVIYVKAGKYSENVEIKKDNVMLIGDGIGKTIITGSRSVGGGYTTFKSATVAVTGDNFIGQRITFRNTAGAKNHQAVALRSGSDLSVFYKCGFEGYQDTLYTHSLRQFYKDCDIYGTVDFIFGNAAVVIQSCNIYARNPPNKINTITANGRTDPNQNTGIIIHNCTVTGPGLPSSVKTYLGRPWKQYSRTVVMKSFLDAVIDPAGWYPWSGNFALDTLFYAEYANTGPGSSTAQRVTWKGYRVISTAADASPFTVQNFIAGSSWLPATAVPYVAGL